MPFHNVLKENANILSQTPFSFHANHSLQSSIGPIAAVTLLRMLFKVSLPTDAKGTQTSTYVYFAASVVTVLAGAAVYLRWLDGTDIMRHYVGGDGSGGGSDDGSDDGRLDGKIQKSAEVSQRDVDAEFGDVDLDLPTHSQHDESFPQSHSAIASSSSSSISSSTFSSTASSESASPLWRLRHHVMPHIWPHATALASVFWVTLALFPGITSRITSVCVCGFDWNEICLEILFLK